MKKLNLDDILVKFKHTHYNIFKVLTVSCRKLIVLIGIIQYYSTIPILYVLDMKYYIQHYVK